MKKITLLASILLASNSFAAIENKSNELLSFRTYKEVIKAVARGDSIRITVIPKSCTIDGAAVQNPPFKVGFFTPNEVIVSNGDAILASLQHFTKNDPRAVGTPAYQYVNYSITQDNNIRMTVDLLNATSYASLAAKEVYDCKLGVGAYVMSR